MHIALFALIPYDLGPRHACRHATYRSSRIASRLQLSTSRISTHRYARPAGVHLILLDQGQRQRALVRPGGRLRLCISRLQALALGGGHVHQAIFLDRAALALHQVLPKARIPILLRIKSSATT